MATALLSNDTAPTINASFTREAGELRVTFSSETGQGFTLSELDVLQGAILHARRQMLEDDVETTPTLSVVRAEEDDDDLEARFRTQQRQLQPVPT